MLKLLVISVSLLITAPARAPEPASEPSEPTLGIDPIVTGVSISQNEKDAWAERHAKYLAKVASGAVESQDFPE